MLFKDRTQAAMMLAEKLQWLKEAWGTSLIVLAIPRGGVVTGEIIANRLGVSLDVVVAKKVGDPLNREFAIGAVTHDGSFIPNEDVIGSSDISQQYIQDRVSELKREIDRRLIKFRGSKTYHLAGKAVVLVDDGVATGTTMFAAIKWLKTQKLKTLIVAIPVGPRNTIEKLRDIADEVIVLHSPSIFGAVGVFYQDFSQVTDDEVIEIMRNYRNIH
ncbi:MAG: phosphoribosyltransferase family protein [Nitrososphaeraceae archaeon]